MAAVLITRPAARTPPATTWAGDGGPPRRHIERRTQGERDGEGRPCEQRPAGLGGSGRRQQGGIGDRPDPRRGRVRALQEEVDDRGDADRDRAADCQPAQPVGRPAAGPAQQGEDGHADRQREAGEAGPSRDRERRPHHRIGGIAAGAGADRHQLGVPHHEGEGPRDGMRVGRDDPVGDEVAPVAGELAARFDRERVAVHRGVGRVDRAVRVQQAGVAGAEGDRLAEGKGDAAGRLLEARPLGGIRRHQDGVGGRRTGREDTDQEPARHQREEKRRRPPHAATRRPVTRVRPPCVRPGGGARARPAWRRARPPPAAADARPRGRGGRGRRRGRPA